MKNIIATIKAVTPTLIKRGIALGVTLSIVNISFATAMPKTLVEGSAALKNDASVSEMSADLGKMDGQHLTVSMSAYTASVDETDSTPCHTANGDNICDPNLDPTAAMNGVPFNTMVYVPKLGKTFRINDRMNRRYDSSYMDIHVPTKADAFKFGRQKLEVVILN